MYLEDYINLGNNVRKYRLENGYTQEEFAEMIGKTANYISLLENGHKGITVNTLFDIAYAFKIPAKELLEINDKVTGKVTKYNKVYH